MNSHLISALGSEMLQCQLGVDFCNMFVSDGLASVVCFAGINAAEISRGNCVKLVHVLNISLDCWYVHPDPRDALPQQHVQSDLRRSSNISLLHHVARCIAVRTRLCYVRGCVVVRARCGAVSLCESAVVLCHCGWLLCCVAFVVRAGVLCDVCGASCALPETEQGMKILGTPLGHPQFVQSFLRATNEAHAVLVNRIPEIPDL